MRLTRFFLSLPLLLGLAACDGATGAEFSDVAGIYGLVVPEGGTLPLRFDASASAPVAVTAARLDLQPVWKFQLNYQAEPSNHTFTGSYGRTDEGIVLRYTVGLPGAGTFEGDDLILETHLRERVRFRKVAEAQ